MQKNYLDSMVPEFKRQTLIDFDADKFVPSPETLKIYEELSSISEEIERCRERNT